ncbi:uncharacterized protein LOC127288825 [Leptopilina boulardi]|uniref:uncharacterized protein LOC127288825 n=1 Tax=Leptopilina boulardi TaxID=63433 RepID=UPI0021F55CDB|nr:uncharacterized protein LOC127288825 [Leptopilina boulardi]
MLFFIFLFFIILLAIVHFSIHHGRKGKLVNKIPGPKTIPVLGNLHQFALPTDKLWTAQRELCRDYYPISRMWIGNMCGIGICHPDYIQIVLSSTKHIEKSIIYKFLHPWLGTGLLTSTGEKWQKRRKLLTPAFHFNILQGFVDIFIEESQKLVSSLKTEGSEVIKDIEPLFTKFTLNAICETAMGTSPDSMNEKSDYRSSVQEMAKFVVYRLLRPWFHLDWLFNLSTSGIYHRKVLKTLHDFSTKIIYDRKKHHQQSFETDENFADKEELGMHKKRMAMLDVLISASRNNFAIDDEGIREEVDTFVFEGHDTTAMSLIFTLALLAEHSNVQKIAREEICEVLNESNGKIGFGEINRLVYLERCIKESLRLYPSVPVITRVVHEDLQLKDFIAPAGSNLHLYIYDLHRDPNYWPNPEKFDPDRFLLENIRNRHPFSYVPFSGGPRNCIGQKFAMLELKTCLAHLLYNFELEAIDYAHEVVIMQDLVLRPKNPVRVKFTSFNKNTPLYKVSYITYSLAPVIVDEQHGCINNKSTTTNLVSITQYINQTISDGNQLDVIFSLLRLEKNFVISIMIGLILGIITITLVFYHFKNHYNKRGRLVNKFPGPTVLPLLGNAREFLGPLDELWKSLRRINKEYYPINRLWLGGLPTISVYHPDDVQIVLSSTKHTEKGRIYDFLHPWLGTGLLTSTGEKWLIRRRMMTPAFHFNILQEFVNVFVEQSELLVKKLKGEGNEIIKDIVPIMTRLTLDSICETAMGTELDAKKNEKEYRDAVQKLGDHFVYRLVRPWLHNSWIFNMSKTGIRQKKVLQTLHHLTNKIIADRVHYHEQKVGQIKHSNSSVNETGAKKRMAMLDILITAAKNEGSIDDVGIREEVDTFVFEGHDTTSMGLTFLLPLLAEHREIQERIRKEVCEVMKQSGGKLGMTEVNKLQYLERCIKESLRIYPSVPSIARVIHEDLKLKNGLVPAGSNIFLYIFDLHRDPNFWPNPNKFDPDRFLPENSVNRHPFSYVPFSGGSRNCIGQKFAMLEMKVVVAQLLYNFHLEPIDLAHEIVLFQDMVLRPMQPVRVKFLAK